MITSSSRATLAPDNEVSATSARHSRVFEEANVPLRLALETNQSSVAVAMVAAGVGVAVLEGFSVAAAAAEHGMQTRPLLPRAELQARALLSRERPLSPLAGGFLEVVAGLRIGA